MNRTLTCLLALCLAGPLAAQHDHSKGSSTEQHAAELLRLSAEKAAAGHEAAAAELAQQAVTLLQQQAELHREHAREMAREAEDVERELLTLEGLFADQEPEHEPSAGPMIIVEDHDGNVVQLRAEHLEPGNHIVQIGDEMIRLQALESLGYLDPADAGEDLEFEIRVAPLAHGEHGEHERHGLFGIHEEHDAPGLFEVEEYHFAPMDGGDLHEELRAIHHELEQLRHELHMLRSSMRGGQGRYFRAPRGQRQGGGMYRNDPWGNEPKGEWYGEWKSDDGETHDLHFSEGHDGKGYGMWTEKGDRPMGRMRVMTLPGGSEYRMHQPRMQYRMEGMPHGLPHDFNEKIRDEVMRNIGLGGGVHEYRWEGDGMGDEDFDFDFEFPEMEFAIPEGAEVHSQLKVIINGEVFEGDEARAKLKEMHGEDGHDGKMRMRMFPTPPTPPEPPKAQSGGSWRRSEGHEDL